MQAETEMCLSSSTAAQSGRQWLTRTSGTTSGTLALQGGLPQRTLDLRGRHHPEDSSRSQPSCLGGQEQALCPPEGPCIGASGCALHARSQGWGDREKRS